MFCLSIRGYFQDRKRSKKIAADTQECFDQIVIMSQSDDWEKLSVSVFSPEPSELIGFDDEKVCSYD